MKRWRKPEGLLLVGEPYWIEQPPAEAHAPLGLYPDEFGDLATTLDRFKSIDLQLVELALADHHSWDRHSASQRWALEAWLQGNPDSADGEEVRRRFHAKRCSYLEYRRRCLGWCVFVLR